MTGHGNTILELLSWTTGLQSQKISALALVLSDAQDQLEKHEGELI